MSLMIDEEALRTAASKMNREAYTVKALNLVDPVSDGLTFAGSSGVAGTVTMNSPNMSAETVARLFNIRRQIVDSGYHLMSTAELDDEVELRKRGT